MTARLAGCLGSLTLLLGRSSATFKEAMDLIALQADDLKLFPMCNKLWALHDDLCQPTADAEQAFHSLSTWHELCTASGLPGAMHLMREYISFAQALADALLAGVELLQQLSLAQAHGSIPPTPYSQSGFPTLVFDVSWKMLCDIIHLRSLWQIDWPMFHLPPQHAYYSAMDRLVSWLLAFIRGRSSVLQEMHAREDGDNSICARLFFTIQPLVSHMSEISILEGVQLQLAVLMLPANFLSKLCCLVCEGLRYGRSSLDRTKLQLSCLISPAYLVATLAAAVGRCLTSAETLEGGGLQVIRLALLSPAVTEMARLAVVVCSRAYRVSLTHVELTNLGMAEEGARKILTERVEHASQHGNAAISAEVTPHAPTSGPGASASHGGNSSRHKSRQKSSSASGSGISRGNSGGHTSGSNRSDSSSSSSTKDVQASSLVPKVLTSDIELFRALRFNTSPGTTQFRDEMKAMLIVLHDWASPDMVVAADTKVDCLQVTLLHVSKHTRSWMQMQRKGARQQGMRMPLRVEEMTHMQLLMLNSLSSMRATTLGTYIIYLRIMIIYLFIIMGFVRFLHLGLAIRDKAGARRKQGQFKALQKALSALHGLLRKQENREKRRSYIFADF